MIDPSSENICYIHGKVRSTILDLESPLVLGIDEYLDNERPEQRSRLGNV